MLTATTGQPVAAPMPITPTTMTASSRRRRRFRKEFEMRARGRRARVAHMAFDTDRATPARAQGRSNDFDTRAL
eukprot:3615-Pyramimonas_sp.AAC.1